MFLWFDGLHKMYFPDASGDDRRIPDVDDADLVSAARHLVRIVRAAFRMSGSHRRVETVRLLHRGYPDHADVPMQG